MGPTSPDDTFLRNRFETVHPPVIVTTPADAVPQSRLWWQSRAAIVALVVLGVGLRAVALAGDRNLWIDEAMLALNLVERTPAGLLEPLGWNQCAPVGFLLLAKGAITLLGVSEAAFRAVPFVGSLLGLAGFAWLTPRILPRPAAVLAVALAAVAPFLISYAAECKQYATDAALTVGLFAAAAGLLNGRGGWRRWAGFGVAGAAAVWLSHPAAFVLGGVGTALLVDAALRKDRARFLAASATAAAWLASFAACYFLSLRHHGGNQYLLDYWTGHFLPLPPKSPGDLTWMLDHFFAPFTYPGGLGGTEIRAGGIAAALWLVGVGAMWRENRTVAAAVALPAVFALLASGLHKYPFAGRLLLFLVPLMLVGVARGAVAVGSALRAPQPLAATVLLGVLVAAPCLEAYQELRRPMRYEQLAPVLDGVRREWQPGDRAYVYYGATPAFTFYTRDNPFPADAVTIGTEGRADRLEYRDQLLAFRGLPRVWLVFSHRHRHEESDILAYAEGLGRCERTVEAKGAAAYLFDFTATPGPSSRPVSPPAAGKHDDTPPVIRGGDR